MNGLPGAIFSGRKRPAKGARGVFFCYALPALDKETGEFTEEAGTTRWYLYDLDRDAILEEPGEIVASIRCKPEHPAALHHRGEDPRGASAARSMKHIKNTYLKRVDAPVGRQAGAQVLDGTERGLSRCRPTTAQSSRSIRTFPQLIRYLRDEMDWPIQSDDFEELTFDYTPEELGIDAANAAKIQEIKRLRPLSAEPALGHLLRQVRAEAAARRGSAAHPEPGGAQEARLGQQRRARRLGRRTTCSSSPTTARATSARSASPTSRKRERRPTCRPSRCSAGTTATRALHLDDVADELTADLAWPDDDDGCRDTGASSGGPPSRCGTAKSSPPRRSLLIRLAELARAIRDRIKTALAIETEKGPLTKLMKAFQEALIHDLDADGFADMYAQTIAYGLLSARIADPAARRRPTTSPRTCRSPTPSCKELMETFLKVGGRRGKAGGPGIDFDELGVSEVVELLDDANMEAVVRDFGDRNPQEDPVIHFYELFLKEYDAKKRMQRGVFYTPRPVVSYIVRSVDELLRTEFGLADGLADTTTWGEMAKRHKDLKIPEGISPDQAFVQILDPATGTGTFLVEVIDLIHETLVDQVEGAGPRREADRRAMERVRAEAPAAAPARLRAADGPLRHRAPQDRSQALRDWIPLRQRRACAGLPDECTRAGA